MFLWVGDHPHLPQSVQYDKFGSYRCPPSNAPIAPRVPAPCHPWQTQPSKIFQIRIALPAERRDLSRRPAAEQRPSGQKDTKTNKTTQRKIKRHTNQEGPSPKDSLNGIGCRYVDSQSVQQGPSTILMSQRLNLIVCSLKRFFWKGFQCVWDI